MVKVEQRLNSQFFVDAGFELSVQKEVVKFKKEISGTPETTGYTLEFIQEQDGLYLELRSYNSNVFQMRVVNSEIGEIEKLEFFDYWVHSPTSYTISRSNLNESNVRCYLFTSFSQDKTLPRFGRLNDDSVSEIFSVDSGYHSIDGGWDTLLRSIGELEWIRIKLDAPLEKIKENLPKKIDWLGLIYAYATQDLSAEAIEHNPLNPLEYYAAQSTS